MLDLHHQEVMPPGTDCDTCESMNVVDFPDDFKTKFKHMFFYVDVEYIDWPKTIEVVTGIQYDQFDKEYELVMESEDSKFFFFAPRGDENPLHSEKLIVISRPQFIMLVQSDPHVIVRRLGYQRGGMKDSFFTKFGHYQVIVDKDVVKSMLPMIDGVDNVESFVENFISCWTTTSFVIVQY